MSGFRDEHRAKLVLTAEVHEVNGAQVDDIPWEKALRQAVWTPHVVQEAVEPTRGSQVMLLYRLRSRVAIA